MSMNIRSHILVSALIFACLMSSECRADPRARDGFYVQLTTGLGLPHFAITADDPASGPSDHYATSVSGPSIGGSLLLGMPFRPGIVLGVGGLVAMAATGYPDVTRNGQPWSLVDVKQGAFQFMAMGGPFVDIYPSPTLGWHVQALVGYTQISYTGISQHPLSDGSPSGIGLMAGIGHDWWVREDCSIGLLARIMYASAQHTPQDLSLVSEHNTMVSPSLEASFTFH
jgi:hypothetical protein